MYTVGDIVLSVWKSSIPLTGVETYQGVISLELLTVFGTGPLAVYICYLIAKRDPRVHIWLLVIATAELYGGETHETPPAFHCGLFELMYSVPLKVS